MPCPIALSNSIVMIKYVWMCRHLRNFNDVGSITNWVSATIAVKNLLLETPLAAHLSAVPQPSSLYLSHQQLSSNNNLQSPHPERSIACPTTISFLPTKQKPLTPSPSRYSSYEPTIHSPLTPYTLSLISVQLSPFLDAQRGKK